MGAMMMRWERVRLPLAMVRGVKRADCERCLGVGGGVEGVSGSGVAVLVSLTVVSVGSGSVVGALGLLDVGAMVCQAVTSDRLKSCICGVEHPKSSPLRSEECSGPLRMCHIGCKQ